MKRIPFNELAAERIIDLMTLIVFWASTACLALGLSVWFASHSSHSAGLLFASGLLGLMASPVLRLLATVVAAHRDRDWLTLAATLTVLAILLALTLRDAGAFNS